MDFNTCLTEAQTNFSVDAACFKLLLSKLLGTLIIIGAVGFKLPQVKKIVDARSGKGLNASMYLMELLGGSITFSYMFRNNAPATTYGETFFVAAQNLAILLLILHFRGSTSTAALVMVCYVAYVYVFMLTDIVPLDKMTILQSLTIPNFALARIPQIIANFQNKSTGKLAAITVVMEVLGVSARVFTTLQELSDKVILTGNVIALCLNVTMCFQVFYYGDADAKKTFAKKKKQ